jgi:nucleoside-diphosphate-sugar epimerase
MTGDNRPVLVTGTTGKQGGAVVRHMLAHGWRLRALTRDAGSRAAKAMANKGVEIVRGDLEDPLPCRLPCMASTAYTVCKTSGRLARNAR